MSKTSKLVPIAGVIISGAVLLCDGFDDLTFTLNESAYWAFMAFTIGGSSAYGIFKHWKGKKNE